MAKAKLKFTGGKHDGECHEDVDPRMLLKTIELSTGMWFRTNDEKMSIMQGGKLDKNWHSYAINIYKKGSKDSNGYFEYIYDRDEMIDRCQATTKAGNQCMKPTYKNMQHCETHK